ncbi:unnamed protein product [Heligmosomoides polygyrus]|uniref:Autophagy-related protein 101 n=1 Tax=Heligmosomoides polygyrus TaxID=6339 RepID=A0A183FLD1_HELPZ|nr:unnamed protein product [Heligmosomoides polygyrus]
MFNHHYARYTGRRFLKEEVTCQLSTHGSSSGRCPRRCRNNFFNKFIHHVVSEVGVRSLCILVTCGPNLRRGPEQEKNQYVDFESERVTNFVKVMYEKANKEVRTSFYFDVFYDNSPTSAAAEKSGTSGAVNQLRRSAAFVDNDAIPSRPSSQSTDGGLEASQRTVDSAKSGASMALSFFDYSQE